uniref:Phospholipase A2 LaPLA2-1 n=1 Tax=Liocheles australasiae TaxID=431266 RepID=PA2_LIOAU
MVFIFLAVLSGLVTLSHSTAVQREMHVHFEPLPGQRDSWPVARAALVNLATKSETGREFSDCRMLNSIDEIAREGAVLSRYEIKRVSKEEMRSLEKRCSRSSGIHQRLIFPGTKWCGAGDKAANYSDLGSAAETDKCCRAHDHCDNIAAGETKYGLENSYWFTKLNCKCEESFRNCLAEAKKKETTAKFVKFSYFNVYGPKCFVLDCDKRRFEMSRKCVAHWKESRRG